MAAFMVSNVCVVNALTRRIGSMLSQMQHMASGLRACETMLQIGHDPLQLQ